MSRGHCPALVPIRNEVSCVNKLVVQGVAVAQRKEAESWEVGRLSAFHFACSAADGEHWAGRFCGDVVGDRQRYMSGEALAGFRAHND